MRRKHIKKSAALIFIPLILFCLIMSDSAAFQVGEEFQVNSRTDGHQEYPDVAMDGKGNFVITWASRDADILKSRYMPEGSNRVGFLKAKNFG